MGIDTLPASEPTESGGQGESSPGRSRRTRQTKPIPDKDGNKINIMFNVCVLMTVYVKVA